MTIAASDKSIESLDSNIVLHISSTKDTIPIHHRFPLPPSSTTPYHAAPTSAHTIPRAFDAPTLTPKTTIPNKIVKHCFTFPHTVIVSAPAFLFVSNELMLNKKARKPFTAKTRMLLFTEGGYAKSNFDGVAAVREKAESSPVRKE
jgi:hypothetical protein